MKTTKKKTQKQNKILLFSYGIFNCKWIKVSVVLVNWGVLAYILWHKCIGNILHCSALLGYTLLRCLLFVIYKNIFYLAESRFKQTLFTISINRFIPLVSLFICQPHDCALSTLNVIDCAARRCGNILIADNNLLLVFLLT